jgi:hypothetical protein
MLRPTRPGELPRRTYYVIQKGATKVRCADAAGLQIQRVPLAAAQVPPLVGTRDALGRGGGGLQPRCIGVSEEKEPDEFVAARIS